MDANLALLSMCCEIRFLRGKNGENLRRTGFQFYRKTNAKKFLVTHTAIIEEKNCRRIKYNAFVLSDIVFFVWPRANIIYDLAIKY